MRRVAHVIEVRRDDLHTTRTTEVPEPTAGEGEAVLAIDRIGCTANNVTYAAMGEAMGYWNFFPSGDAEWGRIPGWGYAEVVSTGDDTIPVGARIFGYFPMGTHLTVQLGRVETDRFIDVSPHRRPLPSAYNAYTRTDLGDDPLDEDRDLILRPLYVTSFVLDDFLAAEGLLDGTTVLVSSASSKTSIALAHLVAGRGTPVLGITSAGNAAFVESLGIYERAVAYDALDQLGSDQLAGGRAVYVDVAGDPKVRGAVHRALGADLAHSAVVGATHWDAGGFGTGDPDLPGPAPTFFFAPDRIRVRVDDWGRAGFEARVQDAHRAFIDWTTRWMEIVHHRGPADCTAAYLDVLDGRIPPNQAVVLSPRA